MKERMLKWIINRVFWSDDETELLEDVKFDKEKELEKAKKRKMKLKRSMDININIEDFEGVSENSPFCFSFKIKLE